jgi:sulfur relay (sulfurtransferase) complex TusBCD TusD component (DsrE family)
MKLLIIIKSPPVSQVVHEIAVNTISELLKRDSVEISGIFFTDSSAAIASEEIKQIGALETVQSDYLNISKENSIPMYVCGRAYMELGLDKDSIQEGFELSGNMELSMMMCSAEKIMEF